jgi:tetratricopeptide (TPR) repeat protein
MMTIPDHGLPDESAAAGAAPQPAPVSAASKGPERGSALTILRLMTEQGLHGGVDLDAAPGSAAADQNNMASLSDDDLDRRYDLGSEVARGGMGAIIRTHDRNLHRNVAVKVMIPPRDRNRHDVMSFIEEAQITAQLEHPSIVPIHEIGVDANRRPFYTMKFAKGRTLKEILEAIRRGDSAMARDFPLPHLLTVFQKICDAIAFAHSNHVIHRDIKPENVMVGDFGEVLVMDWGLAKVLATKGRRKRIVLKPRGGGDTHGPEEAAWVAGEVVGTPEFMAPEQARGLTDDLDERTDVYALGAILYTMLTLRAPVQGKDQDEMIEKAAKGELRPIAETDPSMLRHLPGNSIPESLAAVATKALSFRPERRYPHVKDLQADIEAYQNGFATVAEKAGAWRQAVLLIRRHRGAATAIAAISILLLAGSWINFRARVAAVRAEEKAVDALNRLRGTAPDLAEAAKKFMSERKPAAALQRASYAADLVPDNAEYHCLVGNCQQVMLHLNDAVAAYDRALKSNPLHPDATRNRALCLTLLARTDAKGQLPHAAISDLYQALKSQGRESDAHTLSERVSRAYQSDRPSLPPSE